MDASERAIEDVNAASRPDGPPTAPDDGPPYPATPEDRG
jgi:hypothetical protein